MADGSADIGELVGATMSGAQSLATDDRLLWLRRLVVLTAAVEVAVGLLHFAMPAFFDRADGLHTLVDSEKDFVLLVTFSTGILLMAFGFVGLLLARSVDRYQAALYPYLLTKTCLWAARLGLEILFPVGLDLFWIEPFTMVAMPGMVLEFLLFVVAAVMAKRLVNSRVPADRASIL